MEPPVSDPVTIAAVDELLVRLPALHVVGHRGNHRLVLGPPGAFVLGIADAVDPGGPPAVLRRVAQDTREHLARHLAWVPFVEALAVVTPGDAPTNGAGTVPLDLLLDVLVAGRDVVSATAISTVQIALRARRLGDWHVGLPPAAMIDLCEPVQPTISP